ncbi:MAG: hypothetical protein SGCHY_004853, partial [Lobulomycetales sp.]
MDLLGQFGLILFTLNSLFILFLGIPVHVKYRRTIVDILVNEEDDNANKMVKLGKRVYRGAHVI